MGEERSALPRQWREKLPELLAQDERFAREFARQQKDLNTLRHRCAEAARLLVLGNDLKEALAAARDSLDEGKLSNAISGMSFLMVDKKYQRLEKIREQGRALQADMTSFCTRLGALGIEVQIDVSAEIEGLDDDSGRMMAVLGISNGHMSPDDEVDKIRIKWGSGTERLHRLLEELKAFHEERLSLLARKQSAFERLLENAGGAAKG